MNPFAIVKYENGLSNYPVRDIGHLGIKFSQGEVNT